MDRKTFIKTTLASAAALAVAPSALVSCKAQEKKASTPLRLSFQEGLTPGGSLNEKLDFMEKLGVTGFEPGGRGLAGRVQEIREALQGRDIHVSAICAGFDGFILAQDPEEKAKFDTTMREIVRAAGELGSTGVIMVPVFNRQEPALPHTLETRDYLCAQMHDLGEFALSCGTTVILEPLNRKEAFYLRLVSDAAAICRDANSKGVKCMGDFWHMQEETSDYAAFMAAGPYLQHVHIASRGNRVMPGEDGEADNYVNGFRALKELEYPYYVSLECGCRSEDRVAAITAAANLLRSQWEEA
jgi:sugar phosphate isomerase/epimerase